MTTDADLDASVRRVLLDLLAQGDPYTALPLLDPDTKLLPPSVMSTFDGLYKAPTDELAEVVAEQGTDLEVVATTVNSGRLSEPELSATIDEATALINKLSIMPALAAADTAASTSSQRVALEDHTLFVEPWANVTAWTVGDIAVTGGFAHFDGAGSNVRIAAPFVLGESGTGRFRASIVLPEPAGTANYLTIGVTANGQAAVTAGGAAVGSENFVGVGINTANNRAVSSRGTNVGNSTAELSTTAAPTGTVHVTGVVDENWLAFTLISDDGTWSTSYRLARAGIGAVNNIMHRNADTRAASGGKLGPLEARTTVASLGVVESHHSGLVSSALGTAGSRTVVITPDGYDSRRPWPVVMNCHGSGGSGASILPPPGGTSAVGAAFARSLAQAGFIVMACDGDPAIPTNEWGNNPGQEAHVGAYRYLRDHYSIGPVVMWGSSMGGLASLRLIADGKVPAVGWLGTAPVISLRAQYDDDSSHAALIRTAWGIASDGSDFYTKTAGGDPMTLETWRFRGLPMLIRSNENDATVNPALHSVPFGEKVGAAAREFTIEYEPGTGHVGSDVFDMASILPFLQRCVAS